MYYSTRTSVQIPWRTMECHHAIEPRISAKAQQGGASLRVPLNPSACALKPFLSKKGRKWSRGSGDKEDENSFVYGPVRGKHIWADSAPTGRVPRLQLVAHEGVNFRSLGFA